MLNQIVLVGRLVKDPVLKETEQGKKRSFITLAIPRSFKNAEGSLRYRFYRLYLMGWNC